MNKFKKIVLVISLIFTTSFIYSQDTCLFRTIEDTSINEIKGLFKQEKLYGYESNKQPRYDEKIILWYAWFNNHSLIDMFLTDDFVPLLEIELENLACLMKKYECLKIQIIVFSGFEKTYDYKFPVYRGSYIENKLLNKGISESRISMKYNYVEGKKDLNYVHRTFIDNRIEIKFE